MRLLIWDFDGTLGYRENAWNGALWEVLTSYSAAHGVSHDQIREHLRTGFPWHVPDRVREATAADDWWRNLEPVFAKAFVGVGVEEETAVRLAVMIRATYLEPSAWFLYPDVKPTLEKLSQAGWQHALLTNHVPELGSLLDYLGLRNTFVGVFNSAETGVEKPHAKTFKNVLASLEPRTVWMIGDNPVADVAGAEAVGLPAILVRKEDVSARHRCADLYDVANFLT